MAQVLDRGRPGGQGRERPGFGQLAQCPAGQPGAAGKRGTQVRRPQIEDMADMSSPGGAGFLAVVAGAADDQAAHGVTRQQDLIHRHRPGRHQAIQQASQVVTAGGYVPAGVVPHVDRGVAEFCLQAAAVRDRLTRLPLPGVFCLGEPVDEDREPGRSVREGDRDLLSAQTDVASICPHRHADGQRGQAAAQPVTSDRVQHGERQVASRLTPGRPAACAKDRPGLPRCRPCRQAGTPDREIDAARHTVMNKPDRRFRQPGRGKDAARDDLVHPLDAVHQPGKQQAAKPAHRAKFCWCQRRPPNRQVTIRVFHCNPGRLQAATPLLRWLLLPPEQRPVTFASVYPCCHGRTLVVSDGRPYPGRPGESPVRGW
jgi:hypothetical protein